MSKYIGRGQSVIVNQAYTKTEADARYKAIDAPDGGPFIGTDSIIRYNANTITENLTIPANSNGFTAGPVTLQSGNTVTISTGSTWTII